MINKIYRVGLWVALIWKFYVILPDSTTSYIIQAFGVAPFIINSLFDMLIISLIIVAIVKESKTRRKEK